VEIDAPPGGSRTENKAAKRNSLRGVRSTDSRPSTWRLSLFGTLKNQRLSIASVANPQQPLSKFLDGHSGTEKPRSLISAIIKFQASDSA